MIEGAVILDNEDSNDLHCQENFHFFVVDNQGISNVWVGIARRFSIDYTKAISVNLAS